jgi:hypothetical protein
MKAIKQIVDPRTGEVIAQVGQEVTPEINARYRYVFADAHEELTSAKRILAAAIMLRSIGSTEIDEWYIEQQRQQVEFWQGAYDALDNAIDYEINVPCPVWYGEED